VERRKKNVKKVSIESIGVSVTDENAAHREYIVGKKTVRFYFSKDVRMHGFFSSV
jgi:hypothetical protein